MNFFSATTAQFVALVDDDAHSARLITRLLVAHGSPEVHWLETAESAAAEISKALADPSAAMPELVVVDLKASSQATREFILALRKLEGTADLIVVAMAPDLDKDIRDELIDAGADAVFQRHADLDTFRREIAGIVSFWVRNQRLHAIGT